MAIGGASGEESVELVSLLVSDLTPGPGAWGLHLGRKQVGGGDEGRARAFVGVGGGGTSEQRLGPRRALEATGRSGLTGGHRDTVGERRAPCVLPFCDPLWGKSSPGAREDRPNGRQCWCKW